MKLVLTQKTDTIDGKKIAYVLAELKDDKYTYRVIFDKQTKKRFNAYVRSLGFTVGNIDNNVELPETQLEV